MANYYTETSFAIKLEPEQVEWAIELYQAIVDFVDQEMLYEDQGSVSNNLEIQQLVEDMLLSGKGDLLHEWVGFNAEKDTIAAQSCLWINAEESANLDLIAEYVQVIMIKFDIEGYVSFEFSNTCSKPRIDSFGGGAYLVTKNGWDGMGSSYILDLLKNEALKSGWLKERQKQWMNI